MPEINSLEMLLHDELKDLYDAEKRLIKAIPKMVKKATDENLIAALENHLGETETHVERLETAFEMLGKTAKAKACAGIQGIIEEASEHVSEDYGLDELLDVVIVAGAQRAEHYEIAAYGNAIAHAKAMGRNDIAGVLEETLEEEKAADEKLTEVGEPLNAAAQSAGGDESESDSDAEDDDDDSQQPSRRSAAKPSGRTAAARR
jgi:ferritin-like metal-binding protein YciE